MKPTEHQIQVELVKAARLIPEARFLFAIPNGGARHIAVASKLKAEGVLKGVPDLCLPFPAGGYHGLYIEVKRPGGRTSAPQRECLDYLDSVGYKTAVVFSAQEGIDCILNYLENK